MTIPDNKAIITYVQLLKNDLLIIRIVPKDGVPVPEYKAGQFITLGLPDPSENGKIIRRVHFISSHPENKKYLEFAIKWKQRPELGKFTTLLFSAKEGDKIFWLKPAGISLLINDTLANGEKDRRRIVCMGEQIQIKSDVANGQSREQKFAYIVLIQDDTGATESLAWIDGTLNPESSFSPSSSWIPQKEGDYTATMFVLASLIFSNTCSLSCCFPAVPSKRLSCSSNAF